MDQQTDLQKPIASSGSGKIENALNSPFCVTLIGGILLAIISGILTQCSAIDSKNREIALEKLRQRQSFIDSFSTKIEQYFALTLSLRKREIFLRQWQAAPERETVHYPDGRTFDETRNKWEEEKRFWIEHFPGSPVALIYTAKLLFPNPETRTKLDAVAKYADDYGKATEQEGLLKAYNQVFDALEAANSLMARDLYEK